MGILQFYWHFPVRVFWARPLLWELWWASLWGFTWRSGGAEHGTTEMLSYLCHAALWCGSGFCSVVCVCVCVLGNPVEMKGAATHWPGDYSITFVSVPGLCKHSFPFLKLAFYRLIGDIYAFFHVWLSLVCNVAELFSISVFLNSWNASIVVLSFFHVTIFLIIIINAQNKGAGPGCVS